jgi:hypothetical protein
MSTPDPFSAPREAELARAEVRGKQVLLYAPDGVLGGLFVCSRCAASALQPDLLDHRGDCPYRPVASRGPGRRGGETTTDADDAPVTTLSLK